MPPTRHTIRVVAILILGAAILGILPPALGGVPPTVIRTADVRAARLVPGDVRVVQRDAEGIELARSAWSRRVEACAPINFTMAAVTWRQDGMSEIPARISWSADGGSWARTTVVSQPEDGPDLDSPEWSPTQGTPPVWTGGAECLRFSLRLPDDEAIASPRVVFINTSGTAHSRSILSMIGAGMARAWGAIGGVWSPTPAAAMTTRPPIVTREEWGGPENPRCGPNYADETRMAFVHHTAGSNSYTREQADDIVRGIYAYHVNQRDFCDIAYNALIDKFGRIYEGRAGGLNRDVIGAHAQGFNTRSWGVSAIGDFTRHVVPDRVVRAYRRLLAWRLDVSHVNPTGTAKMTSGGGSNTRYEAGQTVRLPAVAGHRHTGFTTCPGDRLFDKLRAIRRGARSIGLPKIFAPRASRKEITIGEERTHLRADLSTRLRWSVDIADEAGLPIRHWQGRSRSIDVVWNGNNGSGLPVPAGRYQVAISGTDGGEQAREATFNVRVAAA